MPFYFVLARLVIVIFIINIVNFDSVYAEEESLIVSDCERQLNQIISERTDFIGVTSPRGEVEELVVELDQKIATLEVIQSRCKDMRLCDRSLAKAISISLLQTYRKNFIIKSLPKEKHRQYFRSLQLIYKTIYEEITKVGDIYTNDLWVGDRRYTEYEIELLMLEALVVFHKINIVVELLTNPETIDLFIYLFGGVALDVNEYNGSIESDYVSNERFIERLNKAKQKIINNIQSFNPNEVSSEFNSSHLTYVKEIGALLSELLDFLSETDLFYSNQQLDILRVFNSNIFTLRSQITDNESDVNSSEDLEQYSGPY